MRETSNPEYLKNAQIALDVTSPLPGRNVGRADVSGKYWSFVQDIARAITDPPLAQVAFFASRFIPGATGGCDGAQALLYLIQGQYANVGIPAVSMLAGSAVGLGSRVFVSSAARAAAPVWNVTRAGNKVVATATTTNYVSRTK